MVQIRASTALFSLSLTPLIDVVFLLLIFFLVSSRLSEEDRALEVPLPDASAAEPLAIAPQTLTITVDDQGRYYANDLPCSRTELDEMLQRAAVDNPLSQSVVVRADKRVAFEYVMDVLDLCRKHRIKNYVASSGEN